MTIWKNKEDLERDFESIRDNIAFRDTRIKYLEEENRKLKSEHYKDEELIRIQEKLEECKSNLYRGFPIYKHEWKIIEEFKSKHPRQHFTFVFSPSAIGTFGIIKASGGDELVFSEP